MSDNNHFYAINPKNNKQLEGEFTNVTPAAINEAVHKATKAFEVYRKKDKDSIANFLEQVAAEILNL